MSTRPRLLVAAAITAISALSFTQGAFASVTSVSSAANAAHVNVVPNAGLPACNELFDGKQAIYGGWLWECVSFPGLPGVWYWKKVRQVACGTASRETGTASPAC